MSESNLEYEKIIYENLDKFYQLRLTLSEFREKYYFNLRKYFQDYEGNFIASREGVSMEASLDNIYALLDGLFDIISQSEAREIVEHYSLKVLGLKAP
jgi:hypothetical protein